ncbi:MAG: copper resistance protein NlpE N-terminal domain-containing protein [Bacteroidetes bacterium]|nr:copper resistance protein NlpE N-terminal domain-containing protein [Bacteroidota bacterium]
MNKFFILILATLLVLGAGCSSTKTTTTAGGQSRGIEDKDVTGAYMGNIPCADCEKISYKLRLNTDSTYFASMVYAGKSETPVKAEGKFTIRKDGVIALDKNAQGFRYFIRQPNGLLMLDAQGKKIKGALAGKYILLRVNMEAGASESAASTIDSLSMGANADTRLQNTWVVEKVNGTPLIPGDYAKGLPNLEILVKQQKITGHDGCNNIGGTFTATNTTITFSPLSGTKMACPGMEKGVQIGVFLSGNTYEYYFDKRRLVFTQQGSEIREIVVMKSAR